MRCIHSGRQLTKWDSQQVISANNDPLVVVFTVVLSMYVMMYVKAYLHYVGRRLVAMSPPNLGVNWTFVS
jgi:hypothetical protein